MSAIEIYNSEKESGYVVDDYVRYERGIYKCKLNTPKPAGAFDDTYWNIIGYILDGEGLVRYSDSTTEINFDDPKTFVRVTEDQTIAGKKTFNNQIYFTSSEENSLTIYLPGTDTNNRAPERTNARCLEFDAVDNSPLGQIYLQKVQSTNAGAMIFRLYDPNGETYSDVVFSSSGSGARALTLPEHPVANAITTSKQVPTIGWLNNTDLATNIVHRNSTETITGTKTYTSTIGYNYTEQYPNVILAKKTDLASNYNNPTSDMNLVGIGNVANDGTFMSYVTMGKSTAGVTSLGLNVRNRADASSSNRDSSLGIQIDADGNAKSWAPTPDISSNSSEIVTTSYINNKFKIVAAMPADPDANTIYLVKE